MSVRLVAVLAVLSGCDQAFGLELREPDAPEVVPVPDCGNYVTVIDDEFNGDIACVPWGERYENLGITIVQRDGELQITPRARDSGGCTSAVPHGLPRGGLIAEAIEVIRDPGAYTSLGLSTQDTIQVINDVLYYSTSNSSITRYGEVPYEPTKMRWWRLRGDAGKITASYSADGISDWVQFAQRPAPPPADHTLGIIVGLSVDVPGGATGGTRFGRVLLCD